MERERPLPRGLRAAAAIARKLGIFAVGYAAFSATVIVHGLIRGEADNGARTTYTMEGWEHAVFHGIPSLWLQHWTPDPFHAVSGFAFVVWSSLFYAPLLLCALVLAVKGPRAYFGLLAVHALLIFSADVVYALAPTRPPWMDLPVTRIVADFSRNAVADDTNPLASAPSLHVGAPAIYALWFMGTGDRRFRLLGALLAVWTLLMAWSVVYTGEHYVLGAAAGVAWGAGAYALLARLGVAHARDRRPAARPHTRQVPAAMEPAAAVLLDGEQRAA